MFRLDNEAIIEAKDPLSSRKYETSALSGLRRGSDVTVMETRQDVGKSVVCLLVELLPLLLNG